MQNHNFNLKKDSDLQNRENRPDECDNRYAERERDDSSPHSRPEVRKA